MMNVNTLCRGYRSAWDFVTSWAARHRFAAAYLILVLSWLPLIGAFLDEHRQGDISVYEEDCMDLINGRMPYRDMMVEYPPYAIPIFLLPRVFGRDNYLDSFKMLAALCDLLISGGLFWAGTRQSKSLRSLLPLVCYCVAVPFLHFFLFQRFDLWPALVCVGAILLFCSGRVGLAGLATAIGTGIKVYPAIFVPLLFILALRKGKGWRFLIGFILGLLPILILSFVAPWWRFAQFQGGRGLQCESLVASLIWAAEQVGLANAKWVWVTRWFEVQGPPASTLLPWARGLFVAAVMSSVTVACLSANRFQNVSVGRLARLLLLPLLGFVAFNQVLSPQFMIWLLPLAALGTLEGNPWTVSGIPLATMLTPIIFPSLTGNYGGGLNLIETVVLVARNCILVGTWWLLLKEHWRIYRQKLGKDHCGPSTQRL